MRRSTSRPSSRRASYTTTNANHFTAAPGNATTITVGPNRTGVNAKIPGGYSIAGKVTGVAWRRARNTPTSVSRRRTGTACANTAADGTYKVVGLPSGAYKVQADPPSGKNLVAGYYTTANANHYTSNNASATGVTIGP